jgi:hypothetical protein
MEIRFLAPIVSDAQVFKSDGEAHGAGKLVVLVPGERHVP